MYLRLFLYLIIPLLSCAPASPKSETPKTTIHTYPARPASIPNTPTFDRAYITGQFDPATHPDFVAIEMPYGNRTGMYLRKDAYRAFLDMRAAAAKAGIQLQIISAARNFQAQKAIWEAKWNGSRLIENGKNAAKTYPDPVNRALKILEYSAMPGASRHHWGTDIDLNNLSPAYFQSGQGQQLFNWLRAHAHEYGFCQPYSSKDSRRPHGYNEEHWHWSYFPIANELTRYAAENLKDQQIIGFAGSETAAQIQVVKKYVLGINPDCFTN